MKQWQRSGSNGAQVRVVAAARLVVARDDPDAAGVLEPHLRRAEHVAGRMQADAHAVVLDRFAVGSGCSVMSWPSRARSTPSLGAAAR